MPPSTTSENCTGTLSAAQRTPETAGPRSETQPERGERGRPPPAMHGPEAATPRVTRYSATASVAGVYVGAAARRDRRDDAQRAAGERLGLGAGAAGEHGDRQGGSRAEHAAA